MTVERQLPSNTLLSLAYVGTKGTHLPSALSPINVLNPLNPTITAIGSDLAVNYNDPTGPATFALHGVSQPYVGWDSQMTGCAPTLAQALLPFPQYCGVLLGLNEQHGNSIYRSFQGSVNRRFEGGFYLLGALTLQKLYTNASNNVQSGNNIGVGSGGNSGAFSPYNQSRAYAIAPDNVPYTVSLAAVYELPVGNGKRYLDSPGLLNTLVGGWRVGPIFRYEYGIPFSFYSSACNTNTLVPEFREYCIPGSLAGQQPLLVGRNSFNPVTDNNRLINSNAFEHDFSAFGYTGFGKAVQPIYGPSYRDLDISFIKDTHITERLNFRFQANFFNTFNNHYFINQGDFNGGTLYGFVTDVAASGNSFGTWNGSVSTPRTIQFVGRFEF
jgi:hypothetical protein